MKSDSFITPDKFYSTEDEKTKLNWFLFEYAAELESKIKTPLRKRLKKKKVDSQKIAEFCVFYSKSMKQKILDRVSGKTENMTLSYNPIEEFFPRLTDKLIDQLLTAACDAWESLTEMCVKCPARCISERDRKSHMFDDPFYYE
jgi:hypothetical protein